MSSPRFRRRKEDRPREIAEAALAEFTERGYDATSMAAVAARAGISKGLLYRYFDTKEALFKSVVQSIVSPGLAAIEEAIESSTLSADAFLRGPFLDFACQLPKSPIRMLLRLLIAESHQHPDLARWYWNNVVSHGLGALRALVARGVENGEFQPSALDRFPHLLLSPVILSAVWLLVLQPQQPLDTDAMIRAHIELVLDAIRAPGTAGEPA